MEDKQNQQFIKIGKVADILGTSVQTIRNYEYTKGLSYSTRSKGGHRLYKEEEVNSFYEKIKRG